MKFAAVASLAIAASALKHEQMLEDAYLVEMTEAEKEQFWGAAFRAAKLVARYGPKALKYAAKYGPSVVSAVESLLG